MGRTKHSDEYKAQAVQLILQDGWTYKEVAKAAEVTDWTVRTGSRWQKRAAVGLKCHQRAKNLSV